MVGKASSMSPSKKRPPPSPSSPTTTGGPPPCRRRRVGANSSDQSFVPIASQYDGLGPGPLQQQQMKENKRLYNKQYHLRRKQEKAHLQQVNENLQQDNEILTSGIVGLTIQNQQNLVNNQISQANNLVMNHQNLIMNSNMLSAQTVLGATSQTGQLLGSLVERFRVNTPVNTPNRNRTYTTPPQGLLTPHTTMNVSNMDRIMFSTPNSMSNMSSTVYGFDHWNGSNVNVPNNLNSMSNISNAVYGFDHSNRSNVNVPNNLNSMSNISNGQELAGSNVNVSSNNVNDTPITINNLKPPTIRRTNRPTDGESGLEEDEEDEEAAFQLLQLRQNQNQQKAESQQSNMSSPPPRNNRDRQSLSSSARLRRRGRSPSRSSSPRLSRRGRSRSRSPSSSPRLSRRGMDAILQDQQIEDQFDAAMHNQNQVVVVRNQGQATPPRGHHSHEIPLTPSQHIERLAREMGGGRLLPENVELATRTVQLDQHAQDQALGLGGLLIQHDHNVIQGVQVAANQMNHNQEIRQRHTHHLQNLDQRNSQHEDEMNRRDQEIMQQDQQHQEEVNRRHNQQLVAFLTDMLRYSVMLSIFFLLLILAGEMSDWWHEFQQNPCQCLESLIWGPGEASSASWRIWSTDAAYVDNRYLYWMGYLSPFQSSVGWSSIFSVGQCWLAGVLVLIALIGFCFVGSFLHPLAGMLLLFVVGAWEVFKNTANAIVVVSFIPLLLSFIGWIHYMFVRENSYPLSFNKLQETKRDITIVAVMILIIQIFSFSLFMYVKE